MKFLKSSSTYVFFILNSLGDEIPKEDVAKLLDELCDKEDDEGFIPYVPFIDRLCGKA